MFMEDFLMEQMMFNPFEVDTRDFTVTFHKANDPSDIRVITGNLFGPDRGATLDEPARIDYLNRLYNGDLVKVYDLTVGAWKSFYTTKVISCVVV